MHRLMYLFIILFLLACQSRYERLKQKITEQERIVSNNGKFNAIEGRKLYDLYVEFINRYPADTSVASVHFQAGKLSLLINEHELAKHHFMEVITKHTHSRFLPEALVYMGFIEETFFHNLQEAEKWYRMFVAKFPDHPLAADVTANIELLYKSPEEIARSLRDTTDDYGRKEH